MSRKYIVTDLQSGKLYDIKNDGTLIGQRVASTAGVVAFDHTASGTKTLTQATPLVDNPGYGAYHKVTAMRSPVDGETLINPVGLRLFASVVDAEPGAMATCEFFVDSTSVAGPIARGASTGMGALYQYSYEYYTHVSDLTLTPGDHTVWARGVVLNGPPPDGALDSVPLRINVIDRPTYGSTVDLTPATGDLVISGGTTYVGSAGSRILIEGHRLRSMSGTPTNINFQYVDFIGVTDLNFTTTGTVTIENCRFFECGHWQLAQNGTGAASVKNNLWSSNSFVIVNQGPETQGTVFCAQWTGTSSGLKVFEGNNTGASSHYFNSPNWTVGGSTVAKGNINIGPRCGFWFGSGAHGTYKIQRNYSQHDYPPTFSQGSNFELGFPGASSTPTVVEHNVIVGGSWPVRFQTGEFRYNLIHGVGMEGAIWTGNGTADIHHNIIFAPYMTRGAPYQIYACTTTVRNNTILLPYESASDVEADNIYIEEGSLTLNSNILVDFARPAIVSAGGTLTAANYNCFHWDVDPAGAHYSPVITPANDVTGNPAFVLPFPYLSLQWSLDQVWNRVLTVADILSTTRSRYTPTAVVIDTGDTATYGAGNDIGAVGAGTANASDLFGVGV